MTIPGTSRDADAPILGNPVRFWERRRLTYNAALSVVVLLWLAFTWPHFRPAFTFSSLLALLVLALLANVCYSAGYLADVLIRALVRRESWRRARWVLFLVGTAFALVLENSWIADEIYPYASEPPKLFSGANAMWTATIASNMNFPAPLAILGFLAACGGGVLALGAALIFWFARKPKFARISLVTVGAGVVTYLALLIGLSASSQSVTLARGHEKYFCEIDCHLAYSIADVKTETEVGLNRYVVSLRTRFDETTISPSRPKDAPLAPSPREVCLIDASGRRYAAVAVEGTPLTTPLKPAESYITQIEFDVPKDATGLRLLINTPAAWADHFVIGDENSWLHKKTYLAL